MGAYGRVLRCKTTVRGNDEDVLKFAQRPRATDFDLGEAPDWFYLDTAASIS